MKLHSGPTALNEFRRLYTGRRLLDDVATYKNLRIDLPVGVGKSYMIDDVVAAAIELKAYDLVIVLVPTRQLIDERRFITSPPEGVNIVNLRPRPAKDCGSELNQTWSKYEKQGLGLLGRQTLCKQCSNSSMCFWPHQYSEGLKGAAVVYATQVHLQRSSDFIQMVQNSAEAESALVLIDEGTLLASPFAKHIAKGELQNFTDAVELLSQHNSDDELKHWCQYGRLLQRASTDDLRRPDWIVNSLDTNLVLELQRTGVDQFGDDFQYIAPQIEQFGRSALSSRARLPNGGIRCSITPSIKTNFVFFSGSTSPEIVEHRLGVPLHNLFEGHKFQHPQTRWINMASKMGMAMYFKKNAPQIIYFFALLIALRIKQGKKIFLISRKKFQPMCIELLQQKLNQMGLDEYRVITATDKEFDNNNPYQIPIGHYGMIGTNAFEGYDAAFCLNGYYINEQALDGLLQEVLAPDFHIDIEITTQGSPLRRKAGHVHDSDRYYDVSNLAQFALNDLEMGVVIQAVGRVRPYTKPREVFTFQCAELPHGQFDEEFTSLAQAREFFGFKTLRQRRANLTAEQVQQCKSQGLNQQQTASQLNISLRTIKRYWKVT